MFSELEGCASSPPAIRAGGRRVIPAAGGFSGGLPLAELSTFKSGSSSTDVDLKWGDKPGVPWELVGFPALVVQDGVHEHSFDSPFVPIGSCFYRIGPIELYYSESDRAVEEEEVGEYLSSITRDTCRSCSESFAFVSQGEDVVPHSVAAIQESRLAICPAAQVMARKLRCSVVDDGLLLVMDRGFPGGRLTSGSASLSEFMLSYIRCK